MPKQTKKPTHMNGLYNSEMCVVFFDNGNWLTVLRGFKPNGRLGCTRAEVETIAKVLSSLGPLRVHSYMPGRTVFVKGKKVV